jgi:hypothetical protein
MWRIGLALYAKAGGVPWKLAEMDPETAYIGISYAVRPPMFRVKCEGFEQRHGGSLIETRTQVMIGEETCASHALSSPNIMADFSEPSLNPAGLEERSTHSC